MQYDEETKHGRSDIPQYIPSSDQVWNSRVQWGAILAGTFAGLAATILMATIGAAIGITAGAAGVANSDSVSGETAGKVGVGAGIVAGVWVLLTALAAGLVGGWALNSTARRDRAYSSVLFGGITWSVGMCFMLAVAAPGIGGMFSGLGAGAGGAAAAVENRSDLTVRSDAPARAGTEQPRPLTDEQKLAAKDAADKTATAAATAIWFGLGGQLVGLIATILAAGRKRHTGARVVTEIRPRPVPTA